MEAEERDRVSKKADALRLELKIWEQEIAAKTGGNKPSREEIKANPSIAKKYSEYSKLREVLSGKRPYQKLSSPPTKSRKRKHEDSRSTTTTKRLAATPSKPVNQPYSIDPYDSPSLVRKLFVGPTPQKDGQPLGLFDVLSEEDATPLKNGTTNLNGIQATPSKRSQAQLEIASAQKHSRTPASSGKRFMLSSFLTPSKSTDLKTGTQHTPQGTVSKLNFFGTPSFLRRGGAHSKALPPIAEDGAPLSPEILRGPRKPLVRGLSSMLASLRGMEEEAADEDLDILRELEAEPQGPKTNANPKPKPEVQVEDSQVQPRLLSGFDDEGMYDSEPENEGKDRSGEPLKIYKKKGQKRTTRRVNMKPARTKPSVPQPTYQDDSDDELAGDHVPPDLDDDIEHTEDIIGESQLAEGFMPDARNFDTDSSGSEYTASEGGTRRRRPNQIKKTKVVGADGKEQKIKTKVKKVGALAHQNFKRLKLRNTGAKGGPGVGSRFRRRR